MGDSDGRIPVRTKWLRLGLLLAVLHYVFLLLVVTLLEFDPELAIAVAVGVSLIGGIALLVFIMTLR